MRSKSILFSFTTSLGLCALACGAEDPTRLGETGGTSNATAGQQSALGGTAGSAAGTGGTAAGVASSGGGAGLGAGGSTGGAVGSGGLPSGGSGSGGSSGALSAGAGAGAGAGGGSTAGAAGQSIGGSGFGSGGAGAGGGGMSGAGVVTAGSSGSGTSGASAGGAPSMFAPVADIIGLSCATNACHPNSKGQHSNLHNTDGKLYERLLATGATINGADAVCANLPLVVAGSPETSLIMTMITGDEAARGKCGDKMPYKCPDDMAQTVCLTDPEVATIRNWIAGGALP